MGTAHVMLSGFGSNGSHSMTRYRIGIDVGGTFTDLAAFDEESGQTHLIKTLSTPNDPSQGVIEAARQFMSMHPGEVESVVHASTVGTNLFLGQVGLDLPRGALITTKGFRDVLEIGRQNRPQIYNPFFQRPPPLIDSHLRYDVDERMDYSGNVLKALDEEAIRKLSCELQRQGVEVVAVGFLHSYVNPEHEIRTRDILLQELPEVIVVLSCEVDPEHREYERISTTVVNSLMIPVVSRYLNNLSLKLAELAASAPLYIMQSNGGLSTVEVASKLPVATVESGPATGVTAAARWSEMLSIDKMLSFDMGGTTAKAGVVMDGILQMVNECEVGGTVHGGRSVKGSGYPVRYPFVDLAEVSGGGGTIAWVDEGNALMVGPISAGADPGPACYGRGGTNPTVTDASLVLNRLSPGIFSNGAIKLSPELAAKAVKEKIADPLGLSAVEAAAGIIEIVNHHMMRALRLVSIERGQDPREFTMLAFGGSGPMHGAFLAEGLGIRRIIIPPNPGVFSALGLIMADFRHDSFRSIMQELDRVNPAFLENVYMEMETASIETFRQEGFPSDRVTLERNLAMRYLGQSYELMIPVPSEEERVDELFHKRHQEIYGYSGKDEPIEIVSAHLVARGRTAKPVIKQLPPGKVVAPVEALMSEKEVYFNQTGWVPTLVYCRDELLADNQFDGPAIIEQYDATCVIPPAWSVKIDTLGNLNLTRAA